MKERCSYSLKWQLSPGRDPFPANYDDEVQEGLHLNAPISVSQSKCHNEVPQECVCTPFYRERDITPLVLCWNIPDSMVEKPLIG